MNFISDFPLRIEMLKQVQHDRISKMVSVCHPELVSGFQKDLMEIRMPII